MKKIYKKPVTTSVELRNSESILSGSALHADGDNIKGSLYDDTQALSTRTMAGTSGAQRIKARSIDS